MERTETVRTQMLTATVPFVLAAAQIQGVKRVALVGSLLTGKVRPKDIDLLISVEDSADLVSLATAGRRYQGRMGQLTHGNYGVDLFMTNTKQQYLGRLCHRKSCPCYCQSCQAKHCGQRQYLCDDLQVVTLERSLLVAPPLEVWPTIVARVAIPTDVEQHLLQPLIDQLGIRRTEQIIPHSVRADLLGKNGMLDQMVLAALDEAAAFLEVILTEEVICRFIEIQPFERYVVGLFPELHLQVTRLWAVELAGKTCFVIQGRQEETVVFIAR